MPDHVARAHPRDVLPFAVPLCPCARQSARAEAGHGGPRAARSASVWPRCRPRCWPRCRRGAGGPRPAC